MDSENDLLSASLESVDSNKRIDKYMTFYSEFRREYDILLSNALEWIKSELLIVSDDIDLAPLKEELKSNEISIRRKRLLSALIFEHAVRDSIQKYNPATATVMAMHMLDNIWNVKFELYDPHSSLKPASRNSVAQITTANKKKPKISKDILKREKILTTLIEKSEKRINDTQIQKQNESAIQTKPTSQANITESLQKNPSSKTKEEDLFKDIELEYKAGKISIDHESKKNTKKKRKGVFSKVRDRLPLRLGKKNKKLLDSKENTETCHKEVPDESLLENPNDSAIIVNPGLKENINNPLPQPRQKFGDKYNESGITVRKVLKTREHELQNSVGNTIIMKLASKSSDSSNTNLSIPVKCQQAVNELCQQFPGYDIVAIRNMAAQKVGVSLQYIENLNILPESSN